MECRPTRDFVIVVSRQRRRGPTGLTLPTRSPWSSSVRCPARSLRRGGKVRRLSANVALTRATSGHTNLITAKTTKARLQTKPNKLKQIRLSWACKSKAMRIAITGRASRSSANPVFMPSARPVDSSQEVKSRDPPTPATKPRQNRTRLASLQNWLVPVMPSMKHRATAERDSRRAHRMRHDRRPHTPRLSHHMPTAATPR